MKLHALVLIFVAIAMYAPENSSDGYELRCPEQNERRLRAKKCSYLYPIDNYACLFNINNNRSQESWNEVADYAPPGERYILSGVRTTSPCPVGRFQPFALWANDSSQCLFVKSLCEEEGQIITSRGTTLSDQTCQCDFSYGYHFISEPKDLCGCVPSSEDCSCYFDRQKQLTFEENKCIQKYVDITTSLPHKRTTTLFNFSIVYLDVNSFNRTPRVVIPFTIAIIAITGLIISCYKPKTILRGKTTVTVAIDLGTTSSVYAYCTSTTPKTTDIKLNKEWDAYYRGLRSTKTPTCILLDNNKKVLCIGYEAKKEYQDYVYDKEAQNYYFVDRFKMELYRLGTEVTENLTIQDIKGRKLPAVSVFSQMIFKLKERVIHEDMENKYHADNIQWVLSIPAVWSDRAEHFMRTCAGRAGISDDKLNVVVESESASVYIHYLLKENILISSKPGLPKTYLVIDLGGGTDDITAHRITSRGKLKELCKPSGGSNGGKKVDTVLWSRFEKLVGKKVMEDLKLEGSYLEFVEEVENMNSFISGTRSEKLSCKFPLDSLNKLCQKYCNKEFQELLDESDLHNRITIVNERLRIDRDLLLEIISRVADDIVNDIKFVIKKARACRKIDTFILVGGFSNSEAVRNKIRENFGNVNLLYPPSDVELSVVKGAVLYGLNPRYIKSSS